MERLLLVNIEQDPDSVYKGFEPQVFDDAVHGKGCLVIGWRVDGSVDIYHEPGLKLDPGLYSITGKGLNSMVERDMPAAYFEINDHGVQANIAFYDVMQREVRISIIEKNKHKRLPFGLLAPLGSTAEKPTALPLVYLHDFYFVRKRHTRFEVSIDGRQHQPDELPMPIDWTKMLFTRYCPRPLIATLNPAFEGQPTFFEAEPGSKQAMKNEHEFYMLWNGATPSINRIIRNNAVHPIEIRFNDPFPDISSLADNTILKGNFEILAHPSTGKIGGHYLVEKQGGLVRIIMVPSKGWHPRPGKLSLRFIFFVAKVFKKWPSTYEWSALIREQADGTYTMLSEWKRI